MAKGKRNIMTNARDLNKFNRRKPIVTNTRQNIHAIGGRTTRAVGTRPGMQSGNFVTSVPDTGGNIVMAPCPGGLTPCGYIWSGDEPGMGDRRVRCCSQMDRSIGRDR